MQKQSHEHQYKALKDLQTENAALIEQIQQYQEQINKLIWQIPQTGIHEDIEDLKQSVRVPFVSAASSEDHQVIQIDKAIEKQSKNKRIQFLREKRDMLGKIQKLKTDSNLYQSHRRVILKEYLENLRKKIAGEEEKTNELRKHNEEYEGLLAKQQSLQKELERSGTELMSASRMG